MSEWVNLGDVNPLEHGGFFIRKDDENSYDVVALHNLEESAGEPGWLIENGYVCLDDEWIDWERVKEFAGIVENVSDEMLVRSAWDYYEHVEFNGSYMQVDKKEEVLDILSGWGIEL